LFFIVGLVGILHHEMWRDEYQAWLVARDAHTLPELLRNLRYEGNPFVWHLLLFGLNTLTEAPGSMQALNLAVGVATVYVISRHAPFPLAWRVLLTFGYYTLFEFTMISRVYGLGFLLVVIACVWYRSWQKRPIRMTVLIGVLANTTVFGLLLALGFAGLMLRDAIAWRGRTVVPRLKLAVCTTIVAVSAAMSVMQIYPEPDNTFPVSRPSRALEPMRWAQSFGRIAAAYVALPRLAEDHYWNTSVLDSVRSDGTSTRVPWWIAPVLSGIVMLAFSVYLSRAPDVAAFYLGGTIALVALVYFTGFTSQRYVGHLFVWLVAAMWLGADRMSRDQPASGDDAGRWRRPIGQWAFTLLLVSGCAGGAGAYYRDYREPFSRSAEVAAYLRTTGLEREEIVALTDFTVSPLAAHLRRRLYYPQQHAYGSFVVWNSRRVDQMSHGDVIPDIEHVVRATPARRAVLIVDTPLIIVDQATGRTRPIVRGLLTRDLTVRLVHHVPPGIVADELYYIYLIGQLAGGK
jgi:hypothetical protein